MAGGTEKSGRIQLIAIAFTLLIAVIPTLIAVFLPRGFAGISLPVLLFISVIALTLGAEIFLLKQFKVKFTKKPLVVRRLRKLTAEAVIEAASDAFLVVNPTSLVIADCNEAAERLFGLDRSEIVGRSVVNVFPYNESDKVLALFTRLYQTNTERRLEIALESPEGEELVAEFKVHLVNTGKSSFIVASARDITDRIRDLAKLGGQQAISQTYYEISCELSKHEDADEITQVFIRSLLKLVPLSRISVRLYGDHWVEIRKDMPLPGNNGGFPVGRVFEIGRVPGLDDLRGDLKYKIISRPFDAPMFRLLDEDAKSPNLPRELLFAPMKLGADFMGIILAETMEENAFSPEIGDLISRLSTSYCNALLKAEYAKREKLRSAQLKLINDLPQNILKSSSIDEILHDTARYLIDLFNFENVFLFLVDEILQELYLFTSVGREADFLSVGLRLNMGEGLPGIAAKSGDIQIALDTKTDRRFINLFPGALTVGSETAIPIRKGDLAIGVLNVLNRQPNSFRESDISLLETVASLLATALVNAYSFECLRERSETLEAYKEHIASDLTLASKLQNNLLPWDFVHPNLEVSLEYAPERQVGGDYAKVTSQGDSIYLIIGDVSGHGIAAALVMSGINSEVERLISSYASPTEITHRVNEYIAENFGFMGLYLTFFCSRLNIHSGVLEYINAGHPPVIVQTPENEIVSLESSNFPLGLLKDEFKQNVIENTIRLRPGTRLFLYTDGMINERIGLDMHHLQSVIVEFQNRQVAEMPNELLALCSLDFDDSQFDDDRLIVVAEYRDRVKIYETFSTIENIDRITKKLVSLCNAIAYSQDEIMILHLSVYEMMVNCIKHGHMFDTNKIATIEGLIQPGSWNITITDQGRGFDFAKVEQMSLESEDPYQTSGRGILLTKRIVDYVEFSNNGRAVSLGKRIEEESNVKKSSGNL